MVITFQRKTAVGRKAFWSDAFSVDAVVKQNEKSTTFTVKRDDVQEDFRIEYKGDYYKITSVKGGVVNATKITKEVKQYGQSSSL